MYKFNNIITHVPTACLIEDYQTLQKALDAIDICPHDTQEYVRCVMDCLASVIDSCTEVPAGLDIKPSPSSLIAMSCKEGVLTDENGKDFPCIGGKPVSNVLSGGCCQCDKSCPYFNAGCDPEMCRIQLPSGFCYEPGSREDEELLRRLGEEAEDDAPESVRLPTCEEWDCLADIVDERNDVMHWQGMLSWCEDADPAGASARAVRGRVSARHWDYNDATIRNVGIGFRPVLDALALDTLVPDGATVMIGTLYMDDQPVKVPRNPTEDGDIPDYIPGAKLVMGAPIQDAAYQVQAIKVGNVLIADRVLLKNISLEDLHEQGIC